MRFFFLLFLLSAPSWAGSVLLDFNKPGITSDFDLLGNYYDGGLGGNYGVTAYSSSLDAYTDRRGELNFQSLGPGYIQARNGFTGSILFEYAERNTTSSFSNLGVAVLGDNSQVLGTAVLNPIAPGVFQYVSLSFSGVGKVIEIGTDGVSQSGNAADASFDNFNFDNLVGINDPGQPADPTPEPSTWALLTIAALLFLIGSVKFVHSR